MATRIVAIRRPASGPVEVAVTSAPHRVRRWIDDNHHPAPSSRPLGRQPKETNAAEAQFIALGEGAGLWLVEAASAGSRRIKTKMAEAVESARLHGVERVDWARSQRGA